MDFHDPWIGTDTTGPGEAVFAIRSGGKPPCFRKIWKAKFKISIKFEVFHGI